MSKLDDLDRSANDHHRNRLLFDWLCDDAQRVGLYDELRQRGCPIIRVKSLWQPRGESLDDLYLLSGRQHVELALRAGSVSPYRELDSGGRFMLGLDDAPAHKRQNGHARQALRFDAAAVVACAREAFERAAVRPLANNGFDIGDLAEQAALHFLQLLFGLRVESHVYLERMLRGAYRRLTFQIVARHFVPDAPMPSPDSAPVRETRDKLATYVAEANGSRVKVGAFEFDGVVTRLARDYADDDERFDIVFGLMAGTVGNVRAAVSIAVDHLFACEDRLHGGYLLDRAQRAARRGDRAHVERLVTRASLRHPPAPFLARAATDATRALARPGGSGPQPLPPGATLLLLMGVQPTRALLFGGEYGGFMHRCIGEHLAWPLIVEVVDRVLRLPGLNPARDPETGEPSRLTKTWGCICDGLRVQHQRDRRLRQQPLFVVLPIKPPYAENAAKLKALTEAGAHVVEQALHDSRIVHFAWFSIVEGGTHLAMTTVFDGDFDAYVEHFAVKVPLFDKQFELLDVEQPTPIAKHPKEFVETIRKYNRAPLAGYFYSAYSQQTVADIVHMFRERP